MRHFENVPLKQKLTLLMLLTCVITLLVVGSVVISTELYRFRQVLVRDLQTQAEVIGANCSSALAFSDTAAAHEILSGLRTRPEIVDAHLFTTDGTLLAKYESRPGLAAPVLQPGGLRQEGANLSFFHAITLGQDVVGTLVLRADLRMPHARLRGYALIALAVIVVALVTAVFLSAKLQRSASEPILRLAQAAQTITAQQDYSLRVAPQGRDEIGKLTDDFNAMLAQIQRSDAAVRDSEQRFRQLAENIHEVFWLSNVEKSEMIYISPSYEAIWGRTRQELYQSPLTWMEAIHPEDRKHIRQTALSQQATGTYDEEYRILRADGTVRWIRDRAFPVRDAAGTIYRIAGIAEDITERKRLQHQILTIADREQRRVGRDLHDGVCQELAGISMMVKVLAQDLAQKGAPQATRANELLELLRQALEHTRSLAHGLTPVQLEAEGLTMALKQLALNVGKQYGIVCTCDCPESLPLDAGYVVTHLYRIAQEAANNAVRHGKARQVWISLETGAAQNRLLVRDDGIGFKVGNGHRKGMGLHIMADRAQIIGGTLEVHSDSPGGTLVTCTFRRGAPAAAPST